MSARHGLGPGRFSAPITTAVAAATLSLAAGCFGPPPPAPAPARPAAEAPPAVKPAAAPPAPDAWAVPPAAVAGLHGPASPPADIVKRTPDALVREVQNHAQAVGAAARHPPAALPPAAAPAVPVAASTDPTAGSPAPAPVGTPSAVEWLADQIWLAPRRAAPEEVTAAGASEAANPRAAAGTGERAGVQANQRVEVPPPVLSGGDDELTGPRGKPVVPAPNPAEVPAPVPSLASPPSAEAGLDEVALRLARHVKENPRDVAGHLDYQLLQFLRERQVPELETIAALPAEDRELVTAVIDGLSNFRNAVRADNNMLLSDKIGPILALADRLRSQSSLTIPTIMLCKRVDSFGVYEPIEPARFGAGKEHPVIVYCEVNNFASQSTDKKMWETKLTQEAVLYTETGLPVWQNKPRAVVDVSRNRRHDFYTADIVTLPKELTIGRYLLKVSVVDQHSNHVAEATVPVHVVAKE